MNTDASLASLESPPTQQTLVAPTRTPTWRDVLSLEERKALLTIHPLKSWLTIAINWGLVLAAMALVGWAPNPLTVILALVVIGTRQLGLAVVMHEAAHRTLFKNRRLNDWAGNWLAAYPIWLDVEPYRAYHLEHHAKTGTADDPDLGLAAPFPITKRSFLRKMWRDLSGQTGLKQAKITWSRNLGIGSRRSERYLGFERGERRRVGWQTLVPVVVTNGVFLGLLTLAGYPALYLLWIVAWLTTNRAVTRIRSIAEHAMVPDPLDPMKNTRTTMARWWERLLIAPNLVNYHLEHHLMVTVPHHNLPRLHRLLRERGALADACIASSYLDVLRLAVSRPAP